MQDDLTMINNILTQAGVQQIDIIKSVRIGKNIEKLRLLKVTLSSPVIVREILIKYKTQNGVYINRDLTKMQQNYAYAIRKEFKR